MAARSSVLGKHERESRMPDIPACFAQTPISAQPSASTIHFNPPLSASMAAISSSPILTKHECESRMPAIPACFAPTPISAQPSASTIHFNPPRERTAASGPGGNFISASPLSSPIPSRKCLKLLSGMKRRMISIKTFMTRKPKRKQS